eukprot:gene4014-4366_t
MPLYSCAASPATTQAVVTVAAPSLQAEEQHTSRGPGAAVCRSS